MITFPALVLCMLLAYCCGLLTFIVAPTLLYMWHPTDRDSDDSGMNQ